MLAHFLQEAIAAPKTMAGVSICAWPIPEAGRVNVGVASTA